jgi:hypothetical protein
MFRSHAPRALVLVAALVLAAACGNDDSSRGNTTPTPVGNTPSNPPPSGVALIAGNWIGTSDFQQNGVRSISNMTMSVTQFDRNVEGTFRFTSPAFSGWNGTLTGQITGTSSDSQFVGNITLTTPTSTGTGTCIARVTMAGRSLTNVMRWEAPSTRIVPNGPDTGEGCRGEVLTIVWIFGR